MKKILKNNNIRMSAGHEESGSDYCFNKLVEPGLYSKDQYEWKRNEYFGIVVQLSGWFLMIIGVNIFLYSPVIAMIMIVLSILLFIG